jgi:inorganic pyrophosphatase
MTKHVSVFIEIEKNSNQKNEYDKKENCLKLDRTLPYPFFYPYSYGFIPNTLALDGDELDVLVISEKSYPVGTFLQGHIIGALVMEDEKGMDEKILVIPNEDENSEVNEMNDLPSYIGEDLEWFFTNYKKHESEKWSKVEGFIDSEKAIELFEKSMVRFLDHGELPV